MTETRLQEIRARRKAFDALDLSDDFEGTPAEYRKMVEISDSFWNHIEDDEDWLIQEVERLRGITAEARSRSNS